MHSPSLRVKRKLGVLGLFLVRRGGGAFRALGLLRVCRGLRGLRDVIMRGRSCWSLSPPGRVLLFMARSEGVP